MTEKMEKRMASNLILKQNIENQIADFVKRNVLVEITKQEEKSYAGPVNYITFHGVESPESTSTPYRLVINSSLRFKGISLKDILKKGPNSLQNSLVCIML